MAMRYGYFDSEITGVDSEGMPIFDRAETSELFRLLFAKLLTNGVLAKPANTFQVTAAESGLAIVVAPGFGLINGAFAYDAAAETIQLETAPTAYSRVDRVVLRCNYLDRRCEIIVKTGTPASSPVAPDLLQPASGDYYELGLATVKIGVNQTAISQSVITDTRADSSVCGYITQFIDSIDTSAFYAQFNAFYKEFVDKSNLSYDTFNKMANTAYSTFTAAIDDYTKDLRARGEASFTEVNENLKEFQRTSQSAFNAWFAGVQGLLDRDAAGHLINEINALKEIIANYGGAGVHNSIYRGKNLGTILSTEQAAAISTGTFDGMYIGDYWTIGGVIYRIAAFDYYLQTGDTACTKHHVTLVPDKSLYYALMNSQHTTVGAYVGSEMYTARLDAAKSTISAAFGSHVLSHRQLLKNKTTNGCETGGSWYDSTVELMAEQNVYGGKIFANCTQGTSFANQHTIDKSQYPLFALDPTKIHDRGGYWLRDVANAATFAFVTTAGNAGSNGAGNSGGVRPAFSIF